MTDGLLDRKEVCELLQIGRSTLYERMRDDSTFPRPCSRPRARVKFKRTDIEAWLKAQEAQRPENRERSQRELEKLARAPRRGEKEKRRRAAAHDQFGKERVVDPFYANELDHADTARLKDRLGIDKDRSPYGSRAFRRGRVYAPSLGW